MHAKYSTPLFFSLLLSSHTFAAQALSIGAPAPALTATTLDGQLFDLSKARGEVVIVNFWSSWCTPCRQEMPALENYYQQHKNQGLKIIAISMDVPESEKDVREVMRAFTFPAALVRDAHFEGYGRIWRLPMTFVIDRQGLLRKDGSIGEPKIDSVLLDTLVTPLLNIN